MPLKRYRNALFATLALIVAIILGRLPESASQFFPKCIFHSLTGIPCPGCGTTRVWQYLMHGEIYNALYTNPVSLVLEVAFVVCVAWMWIDSIRGTKTHYKVMHASIKPWFIVLVVLVTMANWYWNIKKGL